VLPQLRVQPVGGVTRPFQTKPSGRTTPPPFKEGPLTL
jgi:hypothetical protein